MSKHLNSGHASLNGPRAFLLSSTAAVALFAAPHMAFAADKAPAAADEPAVEEIIVTGSSIRGVAPVGSALIGVTRDTIATQAPANVKELMSSIPQLGNFGANAEQSTSNRFRTAGFQPNIHNLGIYATLTLFNGHRMAPTGGEAVFPDPSSIPVIALQRVEVVADGSSAVYGSDAVAGVVNFIYRKNFEGIEASATYGFNDTRYEKRDFGLLGGHTWEGGSIMAAYEHSENKSPLNVEIPRLALGGNLTSLGGRDLRGSTCLTPNVTVAGKTYAYPAMTLGKNICGVLNETKVIPDGKRDALLVTARQKLTDTVELWTEVNYSKYDTLRLGTQKALNLTVPSTNPYFMLPAGVTASSLSLTRSAQGLFPGVVGVQYAKLLAVTAGADIDLGKGWRGNVMVHASKTNDYNSDPELDLLAAQRLANGTTKATALNPFGQAADNDPAVLAQINNNYSQINKSSQRMQELQVKADGTLFKLPGGDVRAAFGADYRGETAIQLQTAGSPGPNLLLVRNDNISRSVAAVFAELNIPLVGPDNAILGVKSLVLSLSDRYDNYEKLGGASNPKYGVVWSPIDSVSLHASYGTSFAVPNIGMITSIFGVPQPNTATNLTVATTGEKLGTINIYNLGGGNPNLTPEQAKTYSVGGEFAPAFIPGLRMSVNYYHVDYSNLIYKPTRADVVTNAAFVNSRIIHPTQAQIDAAIKMAPPQAPITTSYDMLFNSFAINLGVREIAGVDYDASYRLSTDKFGTFNFSANANNQTKYSQQVVPGTAFTSRLGTSDAPKWKAVFRTVWNKDNITLSAQANYISTFMNTTITPNQEVKAFTTLDLVGSYALPAFGPTKGSTIQIRAANVMDKEPPFYNDATGYFPALASPFGRTIDVTLRASF